MPAIEVEDLHKNYGKHAALKGINFSVEEGEVVGLLGPNGAGKSTAMKILTGFLSPTAGRVVVHGHDVLGAPVNARKQIGYLPENAPIYRDMRVRDFLNFIGRVRGMGIAERGAAIDRVGERCGISDRMGQPVSDLSKGYRQRVGLAQALIHGPRLLILDEPTTGLDPNQIVEIRNLIREIGQTRTVVLSTHILSEVQATCDRVVIINRGELVADGSNEEITARTRGGQMVRVVFGPGNVAPSRDDLQSAMEALPNVDWVRSVETTQPQHYAFEVLSKQPEPGEEAFDIRPHLFSMAVEQGLILFELTQEGTNLEEVFRRLTVG